MYRGNEGCVQTFSCLVTLSSCFLCVWSPLLCFKEHSRGKLRVGDSVSISCHFTCKVVSQCHVPLCVGGTNYVKTFYQVMLRSTCLEIWIHTSASYTCRDDLFQCGSTLTGECRPEGGGHLSSCLPIENAFKLFFLSSNCTFNRKLFRVGGHVLSHCFWHNTQTTLPGFDFILSATGKPYPTLAQVLAYLPSLCVVIFTFVCLIKWPCGY